MNKHPTSTNKAARVSPGIVAQSLRVGKYRVVEYSPINGVPVLWIGHESGEGGTFPIAEVESLIEKYFNENF